MCLFLPLLSDSFFAQVPPCPSRFCTREVQAPAQPLPEAGGGVTGGVKSQSKPASSFLTFAPNSQGQPSQSLEGAQPCF